MVEAYPLYWPADYPRSRSKKRSRFTTTLGAARDFVKDEIRRIGGINPVISTNIPLKDNGDLRADWTRFKIDDTGVAVYFTYKKNPVCLCCDTYEKVWDNLRAVGRTIEALRQIDRDGVSDFLNRTFSGFKALPAGDVTNSKSIWDILGVPMGASEKVIKEVTIPIYTQIDINPPQLRGGFLNFLVNHKIIKNIPFISESSRDNLYFISSKSLINLIPYFLCVVGCKMSKF